MTKINIGIRIGKKWKYSTIFITDTNGDVVCGEFTGNINKYLGDMISGNIDYISIKRDKDAKL